MNETPETVQMLCSQCGKIADEDAIFCKYCGFNFANSTENAELNIADKDNSPATEKRSGGNNKILYVLGGGIGLAIMIIAGLFVVNFSNYNSQASVSKNSNNENSASPSQNALSEKAQQIEEKILRDEALNSSDLEGLSPSELRILRNVHFARYGRKYEKPGLGDYFFTCSWYKPDDNYKDTDLTQIDKDNVRLILIAENGYDPTAEPIANSNTEDEGITEMETPAVPSETAIDLAISETQKYMETKFTKCGDSYYVIQRSVIGNPIISQYKDASLTIIRIYDLSEADKLNGITWAGDLYLDNSATRDYQRNQWTQWKNKADYIYLAFRATESNGSWNIRSKLPISFNQFSKLKCSEIPK